MAQWQQGAQAPIRQLEAAGCALDGKLYLTGGHVNGTPSAVVQVYDPESDSWTRIADLPNGRTRHVAVAADRALYVLGGEVQGVNNATMHRYDLDAGTWAQWGYLPHTTARSYPSATVIGGAIYVFGGEGESFGRHIISIDLSTGNSTLWGLDLSESRFNTGCAAIDGQAYIVGGQSSIDLQSLSLVEAFTPATTRLTTVASMPVIGALRAAAYGGELYVVNESSLLIYDPEADSWRFGQGIGANINARSLDAVGDILYAITGVAGVYSLDLRTAEIVNPRPAAGFVDENVDNTFSWQISGNAGTIQSSAVFQWRPRGGSAVEVPVSGSTTSVLIPAGTFPNGEIEWRVSAVTSLGVETDWSPWIALTTIDLPHGPPNNLYPDGITRDASSDISLSWTVSVSQAGSRQTALEVQIAYSDAMAWEDLSGVVASPDPYYLVEAGILKPGSDDRVFWRVRTYNTDGEPGEWSAAAAFFAIPAPDPPQWVGIESGRSRPLAEWFTTNQAAYQLRVSRGDQIVYDSGWVLGQSTEHRVKDYLENGTYEFLVRYRNTLGYESGWAGAESVVDAKSSLGIHLSGEAIDRGIQLNFTVQMR